MKNETNKAPLRNGGLALPVGAGGFRCNLLALFRCHG